MIVYFVPDPDPVPDQDPDLEPDSDPDPDPDADADPDPDPDEDPDFLSSRFRFRHVYLYAIGTLLEFTTVRNTHLIVHFAIRVLLWDNSWFFFCLEVVLYKF